MTPMDNPEWWRWGIFTLTLLAFVSALTLLASHTSDRVGFGTLTMPKRHAVLGLVAWNAVALPALAVTLFAMWSNP